MRLSWLLLLCVAACSPYGFPKEVAALSTGVDQLSAGFASGYAGLAADEAAQVQLNLTDARAEVAMANSCKVSVGTTPRSQPPCALFRKGGGEPKLSGIEETRARTMGTLAALQDYAHALAAVTNAADRAAYDAAVAQLSGAVGALAKNADAVAPGASIVAPATVSLFGWLVGTALDQQRFDSLKAAVNAVGTPQGSGPIHVVTKNLGDGLEALGDARRMVIYDETQVLVDGLGPKLTDAAYRQRLSYAQAEIALLDGLRRAEPRATAKALEEAHDHLVAAVNDPSRNYPSLLKALSDFTSKAAALQAAFAATAAPPNAATK